MLFNLWTYPQFLSNRASIDKNNRKMALKLSFEFSNESPFWELFLFLPFNKQPSDFISTEFKPKYAICQIQIQVILFRVGFKKLTLGHELAKVLELLLGRVSRPFLWSFRIHI